MIILVASPPSKGYLAPTVKQEISGRDAFQQYQVNQRLARIKKEQNERLCIPSTTPREFLLELEERSKQTSLKKFLNHPYTWIASGLTGSIALGTLIVMQVHRLPGSPFR